MDTIPQLFEIHWLGDTLNVVRACSEAIRRSIGSDLRLLQRGERPTHARPLKIVGPGVWELKAVERRRQFRLVYVVKRSDSIYMLHAFQKKTQQTARQDIELARGRFREI